MPAAVRHRHPGPFVFDVVVVTGSCVTTALLGAVGRVGIEDEPVRGW